MAMNNVLKGFATFILLISLTACGSGNDEAGQKKSEEQPKTEQPAKEAGHSSGSGHEGMNHSGSGEVPEGLKEAAQPKYPVGSKAIIKADHMPGMNGAEATIVGAFDTVAYAVTYTPTTGGEKVPNHKWVIHEELEGAGNPPLKPGTEVTLMADHMPGMHGAKATIDSAEQTTVYMVDFTPTTGGEKVTNHKWVTESELSPAK